MNSLTSSCSIEIDEDSSQHIVFLIHGLHGTIADFDELHHQFSSRMPSLLVHRVRANDGFLKTHRGIDEGGVAVAREINSLSIPETVGKVSFIGHSLGGLFARYAVSCLLQLGFFGRYQPFNFITLASPHLGTRRPQGLLNSVIDGWTRNVLDKSGVQLLLEDPGGPLLSAMAHPDSNASRALRLFRRRALYANVNGDATVPYFTSSLRPCVHPLDHEELIHHPEWPGILIHPQELGGEFELELDSNQTQTQNIDLNIELNSNHDQNLESVLQPSSPPTVTSSSSQSPPHLFVTAEHLATPPSPPSPTLNSSSEMSSPMHTEIILDPFYHALQEDPKFRVISEMALQLDQLSWEKYDVYLDSPFSHVLIAGKSPPLMKSKISRRIPNHIIHHFLL